MSRLQADAVALAVDNINKPFPDAAYKRWIASGAIVPPRDGYGPSVRWLGIFIACLIVGAIGMFFYGVTR